MGIGDKGLMLGRSYGFSREGGMPIEVLEEWVRVGLEGDHSCQGNSMGKGAGRRSHCEGQPGRSEK